MNQLCQHLQKHFAKLIVISIAFSVCTNIQYVPIFVESVKNTKDKSVKDIKTTFKLKNDHEELSTVILTYDR